MTHFISAILTAASMLIHSVLGCCWHHAHDGVADCEHSPGIRSVVHSHDHGHDCSGHHHPSPPSSPSESETPASPCPGGDHHGSCDDSGCLSIAVKPVDTKRQLDFAMGVIVDAVEQSTVRKDFRYAGCEVAALPCDAASVPLRALNQTWLL